MPTDWERKYSRHLVLTEVGAEGQKKLNNAKVLIVGAGALGSAAAAYLAASGIGTIGIADFDVVDFSNLQRQILYSQRDVGRTKTEGAKNRIQEMNSEVKVILHNVLLSNENSATIIKDYDIVIDATDNPDAKYSINDACVLLDRPNASGSILGWEGQVSIFVKGSCYRCLLPRPHEATPCAEAGVLSPLPGIIGSIQATEAIKLIIGKGETLIGQLLVVDALKMRFEKFRLKKNQKCPLCNSQ